MSRYGSQYQMNQTAASVGPVIEVAGNLQFFLPGVPVFPTLGDDTILKPALNWVIYSAAAAKFDAELSYVTGGMSWGSDYNLVAPETGDTLDLVGWVTLDNQSGMQFDHAHIKLMAGDVNKVQPQAQMSFSVERLADTGAASAGYPPVTEKSLEDYHLYTLPNPTTIRDRETKQVEFLRASDIQAKRLYVYDGARIETAFANYQDVRQVEQYGTLSNPKVWIMRVRQQRGQSPRHAITQGPSAILSPRPGRPVGVHRRE
jgi:hypothetical protein